MEFELSDLNKSTELEKRIETICSFNNAKYSFKRGRILKIKNTNIAFIEPHSSVISLKGINIILIYFDKENLFLFNRTMPINIKTLDKVLMMLRKDLSK